MASSRRSSPTYCLRLPEERFTHWREEYLDDVEMR